MVSEALDGLTDEQLADLELQQSGLVSGQNEGAIASTPFARRMNPQPAPEPEPEAPVALSEYELNNLEEENYRRTDYVMTPQEFDQYWDRRDKEDNEVGRFLDGLGQGAAGLVGMVPDAANEISGALIRGVQDPIGQAKQNIQTGAEIIRKGGINLVQLFDWVSNKYDDLATGSKRAEAINAGIRSQLEADGRLTGDREQDDQIYQAALVEARNAGAYKPTMDQVREDRGKAYERYVREKSLERDFAAVSDFKTGESQMSAPTSAEDYQITDEKALPTVSTLGSMVVDPVNLVPLGAGALSKARVLRRIANLSEKPLLGAERVASGLADTAERIELGISTRLQDITGLTSKQQAALGAGMAGTAVYVDSATEGGGGLTKAVMMAGGILPTLHYGGALLRKVGSAAGGTATIVREAGVGGLGVARAEAASNLAGNAAVPERYRKFFTGYVDGTDSTLKRVAQNADNPEALRRVSRFADRMGATQVARVADDAVSGAVTAGIVGTPFAALQPDAERAGEVMGGILALGGAGGVVGGLARRAGTAADADIARMFADVQAVGGNVEAFARLPHATLDRLAAMQGVLAGKVDFVPLTGDEYRMNADIAQNGGEATAGVFLDRDANNRARVFINLDGKTATDAIAPHEIGHAILTSNVLDGQPRNDLRNLVNQQYGPDGVETRGREYIARMVDADLRQGVTGEAPTVLTEAEMKAVDGGKTMEDIVADRAKDPAERDRLINERVEEFRQRSIDKGEDAMDWARDEIIAETFASEAPAIDFRAIRRDAMFPRLAESVLSAGGRVLEVFGANLSTTGKLMDNPSVLFRDNPLFQDRIMQKRVREYVRSYDQYLAGLEEAGAKELRGVELARSSKPEDLARSTHVKLRDEGRGVLENDFLFQKPDGTYSTKPQKIITATENARSAQIKTLYDARKFVPVNSQEFGKRKVNGREVIGGPVLPKQFDFFTNFPKYLRPDPTTGDIGLVRKMEASREEGGSWDIDVNVIGTGSSGRYRVINLGNTRAIQRETVPYGWIVSKANHLLAASLDLNSFRASAMKAINKGDLGLFNNDMRQVEADLKTYLANHRNGMPGEMTIGQQKRDMLNGLIGTGTAVQRAANPLYSDLNPRGSIRTWRVDRLNDAKPTGRTGYFFDYDKINNNRMPSALPQSGMAMPDVADAPPFYLKSSQALDAKVQGKAATPDQVKAILTNPQNGIKAEELKWTGVMQEVERLAKENNGKVPKDALLKYLAEDGAVRLEEVTLGAFQDREWKMRDQAKQDLINNGIANPTEAQITTQLEEFWPEYDDGGRDTGTYARYEQYQLPGGENYREVVLALPDKAGPANELLRSSVYDEAKKLAELDGEKWDDLSPVSREKFTNLASRLMEEARRESKGDYRSSHFDTPNYVAHMRLNERVDAKGKPGLFIEELQSDRHQQGREKGYKGDANPERDALQAKYDEATAKRNALRDALSNAIMKGAETGKFLSDAAERKLTQDLQNAQMNMETALGELRRANPGQIPDAPFRTSWPLQLFKRALRDAVADGKEWIGWTTGETQAARYDLSKQVDSISVSRGGGDQWEIWAEKDGRQLFNNHDVSSIDQIATIIGKDLAAKVSDMKPGETARTFSGVDLKVGGEGMKGFYDTMVLKEVAKYVKQWGAQVEKQRMGKEPSRAFTDAVAKFEEAKRKYGATSQQATEAMMAIPSESGGGGVAEYWRVNITPQMREGIKKAGQALFVGGAAAVVAEDQLEQ